MHKIETTILEGGTEIIDRISAEWTELCNEGESSGPFSRPEWYLAFVRNFENAIALLTVRLDGKLRAVLPMIKKRGRLHGIPVRKLQAVYNLNTQRFDLIHGPDQAEKRTIVKAVWDAIRDTPGWDVLETRLVIKDSWLADVLALAESEKYRPGVWQMDSAPFITLPQSADCEEAIGDFFKGSRKHLRQELDRRLRRLHEMGEVEFLVTPGFTPELMKRYFALESKGWKGRNGTAAAADPSVERMNEEFAREVAATGSLFVYELKLDRQTIAMSLNIRYENETIHWKTSYDEDFGRFSPGNLLFRELVGDCIRNGSSEIDFLSPAAPYKRFWASGEREHVAFYIFKPGFFGSLLWIWKFRVVGGLRELRSSTPDRMVPAHARK